MVAEMKMVTLGELCEMSSGGTPLRTEARYYTNGTIPWVKISDIENAEHGVINRTEESITEEGLAAINDRAFAPGTVLFAMYGSVGKVAVAGIPLSTNQAILGIRPDLSRLDAGYLVHWLKSRQHEWEHQARGVALKNLSAGIVKQQKIPLPPLPTQRRIAAVLDKAQALVANDRQTLALYDQLAKSLFLEMFGDPVRNERGWEVKTVGDLVTYVTSGSRGWATYYADSGDVFLRIQNVRKDELLLDDLTYVNAPDNAEAKRTCVQSGDVLVSITADLGRTAVIPRDFPTAYINQHLAILRLVEGIVPEFLSGYLASPAGDLQFARVNKGGVKAGLNFNDIKSIEVLLPPVELQEKYAFLKQTARNQRIRAERSLRQSEGLFGSLLQEAFSGKL